MYGPVNKISLKTSSLSDSKLFYNLRFKKKNRIFSKNKKNISFKEHFSWFKTKIKNKKNIYRTIIFKKNKIGYIRLDHENFFYRVSIAGLDKFKQKNIFSLSFNKLEDNIRKSTLLIAEVKNENKSSIRFFTNNSFEMISKKKGILIFSKLLVKNSNLKLENVIKKIEDTRKKNNVNWMNLLKLSFKNNPRDTKIIFSKIKKTDRKINNLANKI